MDFYSEEFSSFPEILAFPLFHKSSLDFFLSIEKEGVWHPVAFSSHSMMPQEWNYLITDKEMLLLIQALEQWQHYLEGARHQFEIWNC